MAQEFYESVIEDATKKRPVRLLIVLFSLLLTLSSLYADCESLDGENKLMCEVFAQVLLPVATANSTALNVSACDGPLSFNKDPSSNYWHMCKALEIAKNPHLSCFDKTIGFIQYKSLCVDFKNYLQNRPCYYQEHNALCKTIEHLAKMIPNTKAARTCR